MSLKNKHLPMSHYHRGFSLVELLVVIVMFGILTTAAYNLFREQGRISRAQQSILEMQSNGRAAMHILTQSFAHAGFGTSDTDSTFLNLSTGGASDTVTIHSGYRRLATVSANATNTDTILVTNSSNISFGNTICFYPSALPNTTYNIDSTSGNPVSQINLIESVKIVPSGAKVFKVHQNIYSVSNSTLWLEDAEGKEAVSFDIVKFKIAYALNDSLNWTRSPAGDISNPKAIYIYFIMKTKDKEPGYRHGDTFYLPWDNSSFTIDVEDGYHYQSFQSEVWVRNAD